MIQDHRPVVFLSVRVAAILAAFALGACATTADPGHEDGIKPAWPRNDPKVRLETTIVTLQDASSGRSFRWLTGGRDEPLFQRPYGVAWRGDDIVVTDPAASRVYLLSPGKRLQASPSQLFSSPIGVAACPAGIVVTDSRTGSVALLTDRLELDRWIATGLSRPTGVACTEDGIVIAETGKHRLLVVGLDGTQASLGERGDTPGKYNFPVALTGGGRGDVWVGDTLNFRLQRIDVRTGDPLDWFGRLGDASGEMPRIKGIAVDIKGHIWITDAHLDQVALYSSDGEFLMSFGRNGPHPGQFSFPAGVAANPEGRIVVADSLNKRLQIFEVVAESE